MSGDCYDHIHLKEGSELSPWVGTLREVQGDLIKTGYAQDLVAEVGKIMCLFIEAGEKWDQISGVIYRLARWQEGDSSEERFKEDLEAWRVKRDQNPTIVEGEEMTALEALREIQGHLRPADAALVESVIQSQEGKREE